MAHNPNNGKKGKELKLNSILYHPDLTNNPKDYVEILYHLQIQNGIKNCGILPRVNLF